MLQWTLWKQYGCLKLIHFSEKSSRLSSDCFIPKSKLKYDYLEYIKTDRVNTVVFNLHEIKQFKVFLGHPVLVSATQKYLNWFSKSKISGVISIKNWVTFLGHLEFKSSGDIGLTSQNTIKTGL